MATTYTPGVCNIGPEEVKSRIAAGWFGLAFTIGMGVLLYLLPVPAWTRLVLFLPAWIAAIGFLQAAFHFCVAFGTGGLFNVSGEVGKTESVSQQEFRKLDQRKSIQIIFYSILIGIIVAIAAVFI